MTGSIQFGGSFTTSASHKDIENLAKYAVGTNIVNSDEGPLSGSGLILGITGAFEAGKAGKKLFSARKELGSFKEAFQVEKDTFTSELKTQKALMKDGGWKNADTYKKLWNNYENKVNLESIPIDKSKYSEGAEAAYTKADDLVKAAQKDGSKMAEANKALANANHVASSTGGKEAKGFFGKIGKFIGKYSGYSKAVNSIEKIAVDSPVVAKVLKLGKGSGPFLAITGAIELATQVIPTFAKLGPVKGVEQLVKSSAKTVASVGGWAAGAAAGAAIGSVIPGAGTIIGGAVGALVGFVGGCAGSWAAGKVADKVVGKNELDIADEKEAKQLAKETMKNPDQMNALVVAAAQRIQANGVSSEDDQIALASLKKLAAQAQSQNQQSSSNPFQH